MHSQVKSMKTVDLGSSPYWFRDLWSNPKSRFLPDINFDAPPGWLIHLHDSTPLDRLHIIPLHIRLEFIPEEPSTDNHNNTASSDNIFSTLLASTNTTTDSSSQPPPTSTIREVLQQRAASASSPTTTGPQPPPPPPPPKPAFMIPPSPTWSSEGNNATLDVYYTDFMSSFPPESPPSWFAWVYHFPSCSLNDMIAASNIPDWLNDLWTCAADNNTGFPIPSHITKTQIMSREFPSAPHPIDATSPISQFSSDSPSHDSSSKHYIGTPLNSSRVHDSSMSSAHDPGTDAGLGIPLPPVVPGNFHELLFVLSC